MGVFPVSSRCLAYFRRKVYGKAHWLDDLKLRFGWGQLGNSNVALYSSFTKLSPGITVDYQGNSVNTIQNSDQFMGNKDLRWERQEQINAGVDLAAFNNRLRFTLDVYKKTVRIWFCKLLYR